MKRVLFNLLIGLLLLLLKKEETPIVTLADKLNGSGFVIVPTEQWRLLVQGRETLPKEESMEENRMLWQRGLRKDYECDRELWKKQLEGSWEVKKPLYFPTPGRAGLTPHQRRKP